MDGTPSIRISNSHDRRYPSHSPSSSSRLSPHHPAHAPASPMSIPNAAQEPQVPPALPPPAHIYEELTPQAQQKEWIFFNKEYLDQHWTDFGKAATVRPGSSLLGGNRSHSGSDGEEHEIDAARRGSSMSTVTAPHRNSEAMIDPCDKDELSRIAGYRCVFMSFSYTSREALSLRSLSSLTCLYLVLVADHNACLCYKMPC